MWRSFTQCTFIEDEGDIVFFKNQQGEAVREYVEPKAEEKPREGDDEAWKLAGF